MVIDPERDGIDHINIYSKGKTELGRMLTNFAKFPIRTKDGDFMSVEGYWYYLSIEPCPEKEALRQCYGFKAKELGKEILKTRRPAWDDKFETKILNAIWYKFRRNRQLLLPEYENLPFVHYYNYGGKVVDVTDKYPWMMEGIEVMRSKLVKEAQKDAFPVSSCVAKCADTCNELESIADLLNRHPELGTDGEKIAKLLEEAAEIKKENKKLRKEIKKLQDKVFSLECEVERNEGFTM